MNPNLNTNKQYSNPPTLQDLRDQEQQLIEHERSLRQQKQEEFYQKFLATNPTDLEIEEYKRDVGYVEQLSPLDVVPQPSTPEAVTANESAKEEAKRRKEEAREIKRKEDEKIKNAKKEIEEALARDRKEKDEEAYKELLKKSGLDVRKFDEIVATIPEWDTLSPGQKLLIAEQAPQYTLSKIKEAGEENFNRKNKINISQDIKSPGLLAKKVLNNIVKSVGISKEEQALLRAQGNSTIQPTKEIIENLVTRAQEFKNSSFEINVVDGKAVIAFMPVEAAANPEQKKLFAEYNARANEFARMPDAWRNKEATNSDKNYKAYTEKRDAYRKSQKMLVDELARNIQTTGASENEAQRLAALEIQKRDVFISMMNWTNTNPDAVSELNRIKNELSGQRLLNNETLWIGLYGGIGSGARYATASLGFLAAPLVAGSIGAWRARRNAQKKINASFGLGRSMKTFGVNLDKKNGTGPLTKLEQDRVTRAKEVSDILKFQILEWEKQTGKVFKDLPKNAAKYEDGLKLQNQVIAQIRKDHKLDDLYEDKNDQKKSFLGSIGNKIGSKDVNTRDVAGFIDADSQIERLRTTIEKIDQARALNKSGAEKARLNSELSRRVDYIILKKDAGLINYGIENPAGTNYELHKELSEALVSMQLFQPTDLKTVPPGETPEEKALRELMLTDESKRTHQTLLQFISDSNNERFNKEKAAFKTKETIRGAVVGATFSLLGASITKFFHDGPGMLDNNTPSNNTGYDVTYEEQPTQETSTVIKKPVVENKTDTSNLISKNNTAPVAKEETLPVVEPEIPPAKVDPIENIAPLEGKFNTGGVDDIDPIGGRGGTGSIENTLPPKDQELPIDKNKGLSDFEKETMQSTPLGTDVPKVESGLSDFEKTTPESGLSGSAGSASVENKPLTMSNDQLLQKQLREEFGSLNNEQSEFKANSTEGGLGSSSSSTPLQSRDALNTTTEGNPPLGTKVPKKDLSDFELNNEQGVDQEISTNKSDFESGEEATSQKLTPTNSKPPSPGALNSTTVGNTPLGTDVPKVESGLSDFEKTTPQSGLQTRGSLNGGLGAQQNAQLNSLGAREGNLPREAVQGRSLYTPARVGTASDNQFGAGPTSAATNSGNNFNSSFERAPAQIDIPSDPRHVETAEEVRQNFGRSNVFIEKPLSETINGVPYQKWNETTDALFKDKGVKFDSYASYEKERELQQLFGKGRQVVEYVPSIDENDLVTKMTYFRDTADWNILKKLPARYFVDMEGEISKNEGLLTQDQLDAFTKSGIVVPTTPTPDGGSHYAFSHQEDLDRLSALYRKTIPENALYLNNDKPIGDETIDKYVARLTRRVHQANDGTLYAFKSQATEQELNTPPQREPQSTIGTRENFTQRSVRSSQPVYTQNNYSDDDGSVIYPRRGVYNTSAQNRRIIEGAVNAFTRPVPMTRL